MRSNVGVGVAGYRVVYNSMRYTIIAIVNSTDLHARDFLRLLLGGNEKSSISFTHLAGSFDEGRVLSGTLEWRGGLGFRFS